MTDWSVFFLLNLIIVSFVFVVELLKSQSMCYILSTNCTLMHHIFLFWSLTLLNCCLWMLTDSWKAWYYLHGRSNPWDHHSRTSLQGGQQFLMAIPAQGSLGWFDQEEEPLCWRWRCRKPWEFHQRAYQENELGSSFILFLAVVFSWNISWKFLCWVKILCLR